MSHPWRELRDQHPDWTVCWETLPDGFAGLTDYDRKEVVLDRRQLQCQRRVTLAHEIVHIRAGHDGHCDPKVEASIERQIARELIPLDTLLRAAVWARTLRELSAELWVDDAIAAVRIQNLHPAERALLTQALAQRDGTCPICRAGSCAC